MSEQGHQEIHSRFREVSVINPANHIMYNYPRSIILEESMGLQQCRRITLKEDYMFFSYCYNKLPEI